MKEKIWFEVWLKESDMYGYTSEFEEFVGEFKSKDTALTFADSIKKLEDVFSEAECALMRQFTKGNSIAVVVEKVKDDFFAGITVLETTEVRLIRT